MTRGQRRVKAREKRRQEFMRKVFGEFQLRVECSGTCEVQPILAEVELQRLSGSDTISVSVVKCKFAVPRGGHGSHSCSARCGCWCRFSFDYPYIKETSEIWHPSYEIAPALDAMKDMFGIE